MSTAHPPRDSDLVTWLRDRRDDIVDDIVRLVTIESWSSDRPGLQECLTQVEDLLARRLGPPDTVRRHDGAPAGDVLLATYGASAEAPEQAGALLLAHYDTVWPPGTLADWSVVVEGEHLVGPGVFDMKSGLVFGVWALVARRALELPTPPTTFLFNGDEETGSRFSRPHIEQAAREASYTLVLEPSADGRVKSRRKGVGLFDVEATGVAAHAGLEPEKGASAIHAMARVVTEVVALADPDVGTTINVGTITGGSGRNVVARSASVGIDVRISDPSETARLDEAFAAVGSGDPRVELTWAGGWNRPPLTLNPASAELLTRARQVAADQGRVLEDVGVGGASDANFVSAVGGAVLDGLGAVGDGAHARHERLHLPSVPQQVALVAGLLGA